MRPAVRSLALIVGLICLLAPRAVTSSVSPSPSFPLEVAGTRFVDANGNPFIWRGISGFRLAEMLVSGREPAVIAYLDWAQSQRLNVVRVLAMAHHLFRLAPDAGRKALPRLLDLAKERGIAVEVVALADTIEVSLDYDAHVREVGRIALDKGNALVEIANEPGHHTQDKRLDDAAFVSRLAGLVPDGVIVALGSVEYGEGFAAADYATAHLQRGKAWDHVLTLRHGAELLEKYRKPVVSDEPIGAGVKYDEGRRDNEPSRFAAAAAVTRLAGMGATFHYEGGLQATVPRGREAACLAAWQAGFDLLADIPMDGEFIAGDQVRSVAEATEVRGIFVRTWERRAVIVLVDPSPSVSVKLAAGWTEVRRSAVPGVTAIHVERGEP